MPNRITFQFEDDLDYQMQAKKQEIGRGLRLPVGITGNRCIDKREIKKGQTRNEENM